MNTFMYEPFPDPEYEDLKRELAYLEEEYNQMCDSILQDLNYELCH